MEFIKENYQVPIHSESAAKLTVGKLTFKGTKESIIGKFGKDFILRMKSFKTLPNNVDKWTFQYKINSFAEKYGLNVSWNCQTYDSFWDNVKLMKGKQTVAELTF